MKLKEEQGNMVFNLFDDIEDYYKAEPKIRETNEKFNVSKKSDYYIVKINLDDEDDI